MRACGGRMTVRAVVTDPASIAKLLAALRRPRRRLNSSGGTRVTSRQRRSLPDGRQTAHQGLL
jgi:hypothetical protein